MKVTVKSSSLLLFFMLFSLLFAAGLASAQDSTCTDTDGGMAYDTRGCATVSYTSSSGGGGASACDSCQNGQLLEMFCDGTGITSYAYICPYGCEDGACKETPVIECRYGQIIGDLNDDGEIDQIDKDLIRPIISNGGEGMADICCADVDQSGQLTSADYAWVSAIMLGNRESPGRCGIEPIACTDSDGGKRYYEKGTTSWCPTDDRMGMPCTAMLDHCEGNVLTEGYCSNDQISTVKYNCPNGCRDGACIDEPIQEYDLGDYPKMFFRPDGRGGVLFDGIIVIGDSAPAEDVITATNIMGGIQRYANRDGQIRPIPVSTMKLASEVDDIRFRSIISVGNACVNPVTSYLLGSPADCTTSVPLNKGKIKYIQRNNNHYIIAMGYSGLNMQQVGSVLSNPERWDLEGYELCTSGPSLTDFSLSRCDSYTRPQCTDSDGGRNYDVQGTTSWCPQYEIIEETCIGTCPTYERTMPCTAMLDHCEGNVLTEGYCSNDQISTVKYNCPNGCRDGACIDDSIGNVFKYVFLNEKFDLTARSTAVVQDYGNLHVKLSEITFRRCIRAPCSDDDNIANLVISRSYDTVYETVDDNYITGKTVVEGTMAEEVLMAQLLQLKAGESGKAFGAIIHLLYLDNTKATIMVEREGYQSALQVRITPQTQTKKRGDKAKYEVHIKKDLPAACAESICNSRRGCPDYCTSTYRIQVIGLPFKTIYNKKITLDRKGQGKATILVNTADNPIVDIAVPITSNVAKRQKAIPQRITNYGFTVLINEPEGMTVGKAKASLNLIDGGPIPVPNPTLSLNLMDGWYLLGIPGMFREFTSLDCRDDVRKPSAYVYIKESRTWITLKEAERRMGKRIATFLSDNAFWVRSFGRCTIGIEYAKDDGKIPLTQGWNMVPIKEWMVDRYISDFDGDCRVEQSWAWDPEGQVWGEIEDHDRISPRGDVLGMGLLVRSANRCTFELPYEIEEEEIEELVPPPFPGGVA